MSQDGPVTLGNVVGSLGLRQLTAGGGPEQAVSGALVSDLLSYVMAQGRRGQVWVTIQTHANIVAVAALAGLAAIVIAGGFEVDDDTIGRAEEEGVALLTTQDPAYLVAGRLYALGVR